MTKLVQLVDHSTAPYPWQREQWTLLRARAGARRLAHGLLFSGPAGTGKGDFARAFATALLCWQPAADGQSCGGCEACLLVRAGTHPDLLQIAPPEDKTQIVIDQIRELCRALGLKSHAGGYQVALVAPADQMNTAAANSLLKTLEEPTDNTLLILLTDQPMRLPATIRSRCQHVRFPAPSLTIGRTWLEARGEYGADAEGLLRLADRAPLRAVKLMDSGIVRERSAWLDRLLAVRRRQEDPIATAAAWADDAEMRPLYWWGRFLADCVRLGSGRDASLLQNSDLADRLQTLGTTMTPVESHEWLTRIWQDYRLALQTSANRPLLMEALLIEWSRGPRARQATP